MPAQVVVVHQDASVAASLAKAIEANGRTVQAFSDPLLALTALERPGQVELLITCVAFAPGRPHGLSVALMARMKRHEIKLVFLTRPGEEEHVRELGECMLLPVNAQRLAELAERLLA